MPWTDEKVECLKSMWAQGSPATEIAEKLGNVSRNAVIGKAHRLGLPSRSAIAPIKTRLTADASSGELAFSDQGDAPLIDLNDKSIKKLIARAKKRGFITYDELNEALPSGQMNSDQIEDITSALSEMGIIIVEDEEAFNNPEFQRNQALISQAFDQLLSLARDRWGIITQEEINQSVAAPRLTAGQRSSVLALLERQSLHIVRSSDLEPDGMPAPGTIPRRSYGQRIKSVKSYDPRQLSISLDEIEQFGPCSGISAVKDELGVSNVNALLSGEQFQGTTLSFDDLFWVVGMQSTVSILAMRRLSGFVADVSLELVRSREALSDQNDGIRRSVLAGRDFAEGRLSVAGYLRELRSGQQAWLRYARKDPIGTQFPWTVKNGHRSYSHAESEIEGWREWAECMAWYIDEVRAIYSIIRKREGSHARHERMENDLAHLLMQWFSAAKPDGRSIEDWRPEAGAEPNICSLTTVQEINLGWSSFAVLPESTIRIERIEMEKNAVLDSLPYGLETIGQISLFRVADELFIPSSVTEVDYVDVDESSLILPASVRRVGRLKVHINEDTFGGDGVREFGDVKFTLADHTFFEGVVKIGALEADGSEVMLPASLREIGDVQFDDTFYDHDLGEREPAKLHWKEGPTRISSLNLGEYISMTLPQSVEEVGSVTLAKGSRLTMSEETVISGECVIALGASLNRGSACPKVDLSG